MNIRNYTRDKLYYLFSKLKSKLLHDISKLYVSAYNGENAPNMEINGEMKLIKSIREELEIVLDVGANCGDYSEFIYECNKKVKIHLFEPDDSNFSILKNKFSDIKHFKINKLALGERKEMLRFYSDGVFSSFYGDKSSNRFFDVEVDTLDNYCASNHILNISLLKIDVEGHELSVLKGSQKMISDRKIRYIQFEFGNPSTLSGVNFKDIYKLILGLSQDCKFFKITNSGLVPIVNYFPKLEKIELANFLIKFY